MMNKKILFYSLFILLVTQQVRSGEPQTKEEALVKAIPFEIWSTKITSDLSTKDVQSLRLTNKYFSDSRCIQHYIANLADNDVKKDIPNEEYSSAYPIKKRHSEISPFYDEISNYYTLHYKESYISRFGTLSPVFLLLQEEEKAYLDLVKVTAKTEVYDVNNNPIPQCFQKKVIRVNPIVGKENIESIIWSYEGTKLTDLLVAIDSVPQTQKPTRIIVNSIILDQIIVEIELILKQLKEFGEDVVEYRKNRLCTVLKNIVMQNRAGQTPLYEIYLRLTYSEIMQFLLENGVDPNIQNDAGDTPLHKICLLCTMLGNDDFLKDDFLKIVKLFLKYGANPNIKNKEGDTPFHNAWFSKYNQKVKERYFSLKALLIQHGYDSNIKNRNGRTADQASGYRTEENRSKIMMSINILCASFLAYVLIPPLYNRYIKKHIEPYLKIFHRTKSS